MGILVRYTPMAPPGTTVDRIINSFPHDKQAHIRTMISTSLRGVVSQQLLPTKGKPGRIAALEVLINTSAVANLIRQGKLDQLETAIAVRRQYRHADHGLGADESRRTCPHCRQRSLSAG